MNLKTKNKKNKIFKRRAAGIVDVAKLAGVSYQTVSRVINHSSQVRLETRERVLAAITKLDYHPSLAAQALVTGRSRTLGVVSFDTTLYGPASTLLGIEQAAHEAGYHVGIASLQAQTRESVALAILRLRSQGVDGIVVITPQKPAVTALQNLSIDIPIVAVEAGPNDSVPVVAVDQFGGAFIATRYLLELGHHTVWHISGPSDWLEAEQRIDGWRQALTDAGAPIPRLWRGDWSPRSAYEIGQQLIQQPNVTAVFVSNDQMALGLLHLLYEANRHIPQDISIIGFDDIPEAAYFTPPLTTVRQNFTELGRRCLKILVDQIENGERSYSRTVVPTEFIIRRSCTTPKNSNGY
ncbi:MAG: LacI family DNA-binding transcriptional regulator [Deltaproteobacteria bacterium]|nr:LacI family DNA-binding transcriptional regulator [Deltaproteobacteria bacterium]